jgi:branched-chain amino acid transport system substrate-binding protein
VKIGFITDMSSLYADVEGKNGAVAMQMAIDDFGGKVLGQPIELVSADHQNKADIAASKAREWIDTQGISMVFGGTNSGGTGGGPDRQREKARSLQQRRGLFRADQRAVQPLYRALRLRHRGPGQGHRRCGGGSRRQDWFFLTADYAFGQALEADTTKVINAKGGKVLGSVKHPLNASDFSSFLLQAQSSKAHILGLANAGGDTINPSRPPRSSASTRP